MLFLIRETLIINWGKGNISVLKADEKDSGNKKVADTYQEIVCKDFLNCEYCKKENALRKKEFLKLKAGKSA